MLPEGSQAHNHVRHVLNNVAGLGGGPTVNEHANNGYETELAAAATPSTSAAPVSTPTRGHRATTSPSTSAARGRLRPATATPSTSAVRGRGRRATTPRVVTTLEMPPPIPQASPQPEDLGPCTIRYNQARMCCIRIQVSVGILYRIEHSAVNLAESIQHGGLPAPGSVAPSILETGKAFTAKGMQVLELVGKETIDLLITETGIEVEKNSKETEQQTDEDQLYEEVTFDRCFYIYGGPEQLEELEALSNHHGLLCNRRKAKLSSEQRPAFDGKLKQVQQIFSLSTEMDGNGVETDKGKKVETGAEGSDDEMKKLHDSSVSTAADMAVGFTNALAGVAVNDMIQRTAGRIDSLHSEGVHRLSEMCCFAVSQLLMLGKSILSNASKVQDEVADEDIAKIDWPEDSVEKAKIIRTKAQSMTGYVEAVSNSFITGWLSSTSSL
ncbi:uncharacterized protein LOC115979695 [Quercus lobata]|uniref:uncharacterized protein LOC115979695 n=1 Tax=Quercus lobata TaxID=97700 RepID=UPI0012488797|nr:uncharacterized protein LOC115979695 [Quercus lobata]